MQRPLVADVQFDTLPISHGASIMNRFPFPPIGVCTLWLFSAPALGYGSPLAEARSTAPQAQTPAAKQQDGGSKPSTAIEAWQSNAPANAAGNAPKHEEHTVRAAETDEFRIGAGDILQISVWKEPEVSVPSTVVRPDGKITMPLIKDIAVAGLTPHEVEQLITAGLANYVNTPNVTVVVSGINSKKIYVIGAVKKEGPIAYTYRMTVMQAITEAGGLTDYAKKKKIYVLRAVNGSETRIPFDYNAVLSGKYLDPVLLLPNDTLVVPH